MIITIGWWAIPILIMLIGLSLTVFFLWTAGEWDFTHYMLAFGSFIGGVVGAVTFTIGYLV